MKIVHGLGEVARPGSESSLTFGNFDGVHLGHSRLLARVVEVATWRGLIPSALTFFPHPATVVAPQRAPLALCALDERLEQFELAGIEQVWVLKFDADLAQMPADDFARRALLGVAGARHIVVGPDARFGKDRVGDVQLLASVGASASCSVEVVDPLCVAGARVSSSAVRAAVRSGDCSLATTMLGRPFRLSGIVVEGHRLGRQLGFPTANLSFPQIEPGLVLPALGVYRALVRVEDEQTSHLAAVNVGHRPTFNGQSVSIEVHILDFEGDLYGKRLRVDFLARLRGEVRFGSVDELVMQVRSDLLAVRAAGTQT